MAPTQPQSAGKKAVAPSGHAGKAASTGETPSNGDTAEQISNPIEMLSADHRHVEQLFSRYEKTKDSAEKSELAGEICNELMIHTLLEEEIFYPACKDHMEKRLLDEAQVEHDGTKALLVEIRNGSPEDEYFDAKVTVLSEEIKHHVQEEEKAGEGIFAMAKKSGIATAELVQQLMARKQELMKQATAGTLGPPETRSFRARIQSETTNSERAVRMARGSSSTMDRERDDRGRFVSDDDDDDRDMRRRSSRNRDDEGRFTSRSRDDDDDGRGHGRGGWFGDPEGHSRASREGWEDRNGDRGGRSRSSMRSRDDEGRFRSRSRDDDDDGRGHGRGGWFGDPEGHSRASREGWRSSDHEGSGWYGDPEGHSRASREGWRHSDHEGSGWYGDREGHSRASREGWRHSDHEGSGWYGDPEGHSRASREGWDDRDGRSRSSGMRSRDDDGRYSRSRDDDDDRGGRGRGHGGWYGDPRGHAEASREGWEHRGGSRMRNRDDDDDDRRGGRGHGGWYGDPEGHSQAARRRRD